MNIDDGGALEIMPVGHQRCQRLVRRLRRLRTPAWWRALIGFLALMTASPSEAADLIFSTKQQFVSLDPQFADLSSQNSSLSVFFDRMVEFDNKLEPVPNLAVSWQQLDDTTWEFKLRPGVTFHDGSPLTAEDVIFSIERVPAITSPLSLVQFTSDITELTAVDNLTLRIRTRAPNPIVPRNMASIPIASRTAAAGLTTADFNAGRGMVGTGAYRFVEWVNGDRLVGQRYPGYWGTKQLWDRFVQKFNANDASRVSALLSGDVMMIDQVLPANLPELKRDTRVRVHQMTPAATHVLWFDAVRTISPFVTAKDGQALDRNPLADRRVRHALSLAISRQALSERVLDGAAVPASQIFPPGYAGTSERIRPMPYDVGQAQTLLAEAGWKDGFRIVLHTGIGRFAGDTSITQAIAQMWIRIGIKAEVESVPPAVFLAKATRQEYSAFTWQFVGANSVPMVLRGYFATFNPELGLGAANRTRYSDPALDALLIDAYRTMESAARRQIIERASELVDNEQYMLMLVHPDQIVAARSDLEVMLRTDQRVNALLVRPTPTQ